MNLQKQFFSEEDIQNNKVISAISYLSILFFLPLVVCPQSDYGKFHANQALLLFLTSVIGPFVLGCIPFFGGFLRGILWLIILFFTVICIFNTASGNAYELPVIGHIRIIR